ncbi:HD family hydrolase [Klebsiella sp. BIGb0407]|uniref:HD family hydrolase n=1 Tax=Klebsiella sp. BIGb0407 TaxID=2940603 RepID=UPI002166E5E6|nr:HD family hydrolase [Klebsiella sp. BIGb0407]MCS3433675.1 5'-deoxynucleotidase YfbR-like HD superfamily hydrolase [Klebsiella sp. BIGb0407]
MSFIRTFTGQHVDYLNLKLEQINIEDIAVSLSNICRFGGHLPEFYSVAQHSVHCSLIVPADFALEALLHDGVEAYCQDIPSPLKQLLPDYQAMESKVDAVVRKKFNLPEKMSKRVKYADLIMLATERRDLDIDDGSIWPILEGILPYDGFAIHPLKPGQAYGFFMNRFNELMG